MIGDGVPVPMHIRFDELAPEHRPASTTPPFSEAWQRDVADDGLIAETIERWRFQVRGGARAASARPPADCWRHVKDGKARRSSLPLDRPVKRACVLGTRGRQAI